MYTFFSIISSRSLIISLALISTLVTANASSFASDNTVLARRTEVTVGGKTGVLGEQLSPVEHTKSTVHRLDKWDGQANPGNVVKYYNGAQLEDKEIEGLKAADQYVAHDTSDPHHHAVVMKEIKGTALSKVLLDEKDQEKRKALFAQWKPKVAEAAADIAEKKGILHGDLNMNNVIVDGDKVNLIDWEHYSKKGDKDFTSDKAKIQSHLDMVWDSDVKSSQLCGRDALFCPLPPRRPKAKAPTSDATKSTTSTLEKPALLKQKDSKAPVTSKTPNASLRKAPVPKSSPLLKSASTKTQTSVRKSAKLGQKLGMSKVQRLRTSRLSTSLKKGALSSSSKSRSAVRKSIGASSKKLSSRLAKGTNSRPSALKTSSLKSKLSRAGSKVSAKARGTKARVSKSGIKSLKSASKKSMTKNRTPSKLRATSGHKLSAKSKVRAGAKTGVKSKSSKVTSRTRSTKKTTGLKPKSRSSVRASKSGRASKVSTRKSSAKVSRKVTGARKSVGASKSKTRTVGKARSSKVNGAKGLRAAKPKARTSSKSLNVAKSRVATKGRALTKGRTPSKARVTSKLRTLAKARAPAKSRVATKGRTLAKVRTSSKSRVASKSRTPAKGRAIPKSRTLAKAAKARIPAKSRASKARTPGKRSTSPKSRKVAKVVKAPKSRAAPKARSSPKSKPAAKPPRRATPVAKKTLPVKAPLSKAKSVVAAVKGKRK